MGQFSQFVFVCFHSFLRLPALQVHNVRRFDDNSDILMSLPYCLRLPCVLGMHCEYNWLWYLIGWSVINDSLSLGFFYVDLELQIGMGRNRTRCFGWEWFV